MADIRKRTGSKGTTYQVRYPSKTAKSGYAYATFDTMKKARAFSENLGAQTGLPSGGISVTDAVDRWLEVCEQIGRNGREKVEPETFKEYKRRANVIKEYDWPEKLPSLEATDIVHFRNWLLANKTRDLARRTLSSLHSVLIEMKHQGEIRHDPASGITIQAGGRYEDDEPIEIPSDAEIRAILAAADAMGEKNDFMRKCWARYRPMIYLAAFSGMRPSEYRGLQWSSVGDGMVQVTQRADKTGIIGPVKSKAGRRRIFVPKLVTDMLAEWRKKCPVTEADLVFPTGNGKPILLDNFRISAWMPLMREAGLTLARNQGGKTVEHSLYSPYALRHYYASKLIERGEDLKFIQQTMGHSKIEITFNVYGHLLKGRDDIHKGVAEDLAKEILNRA